MRDPLTQDNEALAGKGNWAQRTFAPLRKESLRSSIFAMLMSAIGLGIFSFHKLFADVGIVPAAVLVVAYGLLFLLSSDFLIHAAKVAVHARSLGALVEVSLGGRYAKFYDSVLFLSLFATLVVQVLSIAETIYSNFGQAIFEWLGVSEGHRSEAVFVFFCTIALGVLLCGLLLADPSNKLGFASFVAFLIFSGVALTAVVQTPLYCAQFGSNLNVFGFTWTGYFKRSGLLVFAFNCLYNFYAVDNSLANPSVKRLRKVFSRTFAVLISLSVVLGCCFYMSLGPVKSTEVNLFLNRPPLGETDYAMRLFRGLFTLSLLVSFVLTVEPLKAITGRCLTPRQNSLFSALFFSAGPVAVAIGYRKVCNLIGVTGAILTTIVCFTTPGLIALKTDYCRKRWQRLLVWGFVTYTLGAGLIGCYFNIIEMGQSKQG